MIELWWLIDSETRIRLCELQWKLYKVKLDMLDAKPPEVFTNINSETYEYENEKAIRREMSTPPTNRYD